MVIVKANKDSEAGVLPDEKILAEMGKFNEELVKAGVLLAAEGLQASSTPQGINGLEPAGGNEPRPGIVGHAILRPPFQRGSEGILSRRMSVARAWRDSDHSIANHLHCDMSLRRRRPICCASENCRTTALPNKAPHNYDTKKKTNDAFDPIGPVRRNLRPAGNRCCKRGLSRIDPVE